MIRNAHPVEILLLAFALSGLCINVWGLTDTWRDRQWLRRARINGMRKLIANSHLRDEWLRVTLQLSLTLAAILMCAAPPPPPDPTIEAMVSRIILIVTSVLLFAKSLANRYDRYRLNQMDGQMHGRRHSDRPRRKP